MVVRGRGGTLGRLRLVGLLLIVWLGWPAADAAWAQNQAQEYELKAAFLYNFAKFVEWPTDGDATGPVCLGILGPDPFGAVLDRMLAGKSVHERPVTIRRFPSASDVAPCHLMFVSAAAARAFAPESWTRPGVVSVGEDEAFLDRGGLIAFVEQANKLRFVVNASAAERAQVKLSSQLLKLALRVRKDGE